MNSSLSIIPSLDRLASTDSAYSKKDYTYAEQYPVFISQEKLSTLIGGNSKSSKLSYIGNTVKPTTVPAPLPVLPKQSMSQSVDIHYSKFPSSSLNVELQKQCLLSALYHNLDKIKLREKSFPPIKVVWQKNKLGKEKVRAAKVNMKAVIHGETLSFRCDGCGNSKCVCRVTDSFCEETWESVKHKYEGRKDIYHGVVRSKLLGRTKKFKSVLDGRNYFVERMEQKRTRRRRPGYKEYDSLSNEILQVSPKNIYMKVLADDENEDN